MIGELIEIYPMRMQIFAAQICVDRGRSNFHDPNGCAFQLMAQRKRKRVQSCFGGAVGWVENGSAQMLGPKSH